MNVLRGRRLLGAVETVLTQLPTSRLVAALRRGAVNSPHHTPEDAAAVLQPKTTRLYSSFTDRKQASAGNQRSDEHGPIDRSIKAKRSDVG